ncbi:HAD-IIA family hydrolase [Intrasporangium mesophilum]
MAAQHPPDNDSRGSRDAGPGSPDQPVLAAYDGVICDLDGVVYRGEDAVPGAPKALQDMVTRGTRVVYATNNASRVPSEVAAHVAELGAPATEADIVTSAQAGAELLQSDLPAGAGVLALGGAGVTEALSRAGLRPLTPAQASEAAPGEDRQADGPPPQPGAPDAPRASDASDPSDPSARLRVSAVLQGLGPDLTVRDFQAATRHVADGVRWVATNTDSTLPLPWGLAPGNGAYVDLLTTATGRHPEVVGKPFAPLYELAMERLGSDHERTLAVGDRLGTDIAGADAAGIDSAWVLTGVDRPSDLLRTTLAPRYVIGTLSDLLEPYAAPVRTEDGWVCGGVRARLNADTLDVAGLDQRDAPGGSDSTATEPMHAVRAGLAALLEARDDGEQPDRLAQLARPLDELLDDAR